MNDCIYCNIVIVLIYCIYGVIQMNIGYYNFYYFYDKDGCFKEVVKNIQYIKKI